MGETTAQSSATGLKYRRVEPPENLRPFVRYFWSIEGEASGPHNVDFRLVAESSGFLIFQPTENGSFAVTDDFTLPDLCVCGPATLPVTMSLSGHVATVGAALQPDALGALFHVNAADLADGCAHPGDMRSGFRETLTDRLYETQDPADRLALLQRHMSVLTAGARDDGDWVVRFGLAEIVKAGGNVPIAFVAKKLGVSERSLERKFRTAVGITPRTFARICRFRRTVDRLRSDDFLNDTELAHEQNFTDQSHLIRMFREFSGLTPRQFRRRYAGVVDNLNVSVG